MRRVRRRFQALSFLMHKLQKTTVRSTMKTPSQLATQYRTTTRTIRRWKAAGAPLSSPEEMTAWLASRRSNGVEPPADKPTQKIEPVSTPGTTPPAAVGAGPALRRLEQAEADAHERLQAAIVAGDATAIRAGRRHWLEVTAELRRSDVSLEASRRDASESIPRHEIEQALKFLGWLLKIAVRRVFVDAMPTPRFEGSTRPTD